MNVSQSSIFSRFKQAAKTVLSRRPHLTPAKGVVLSLALVTAATVLAPVIARAQGWTPRGQGNPQSEPYYGGEQPYMNQTDREQLEKYQGLSDFQKFEYGREMYDLEREEQRQLDKDRASQFAHPYPGGSTEQERTFGVFKSNEVNTFYALPPELREKIAKRRAKELDRENREKALKRAKKAPARPEDGGVWYFDGRNYHYVPQ